MLQVMQEILLRALREADPSASLQAAAADGSLDLSEAERRALGRVDPDGLMVTRRIVQKLRFQRLCSEPDLVLWFEERPREFTRVFAKYDRSILQTSIFPGDEVRTFREFLRPE